MTIHIPPAALEAGARAAHNQWRHECAVEADEPVENWREWEELDAWGQDSFREQARAAFVAMVGAWEGMHMEDESAPWVPRLILPLTENPDDKA